MNETGRGQEVDGRNTRLRRYEGSDNYQTTIGRVDGGWLYA